MRSILPRSRIFGSLEIIEVYEFYDAPRLFACRNLSDQIFVSVWIDEDDLTETWLYVAVSRRRLEYIRSGGIDLYEAFKKAETETTFRVTIPRSDGISHVDPISCDDLTDDMLPNRGERLDFETRTLPVLGGTSSPHVVSAIDLEAHAAEVRNEEYDYGHSHDKTDR